MAAKRGTPSADMERVVTRSRPMKVLVMGMGRCGTSSLAEALKILGYRPYDFIDRMMLGHLDLWTQALRAKFLGIGKPWGRTELDTVTKDFDCVLDVPCPFFVEEFIDAYPDAKVVLNKRDVDKWLTSMNNTLFTVFQWPSWKILRYTDPGLCGAWYTHVMLTWEIFCGHDHGEICRQRFLQHYEHVRSVVPKDRLLEYDLGAGWEPLCKFLEVPQPKEDFPNMNKKEDFFAIHGQYWKYSVYLSVKNVAKVAVPVLATAIGAFYYARKA